MSMIRALLLAVVLLCLPAYGAPVRVCILGDSISEGFAPATRGWGVDLASLNAGTDFGVKNLADSGDVVADAQALFNSDVSGRNCTWVAVMIGTNDLAVGTAAATIYAAIDAILDAAEADGVNTIGLAIAPRGTGASWSSDLGTRLLAVNASLAARTSSTVGRTYVYVDTYTALLEPASNPPALAAAAGGATDGIHPNNAGELIIATEADDAVVAAGGW